MKIEKWDEDKILFSDGSSITYDHERDCCEFNWADFSVLDIFYHGEEFDDYSLEFVKYGMNLVMGGLPYHKSRIYIPFYSSQNGCYSTYCDITVHGKQDLKIMCNEGYMLPPDSFKEPDWIELMQNYKYGVFCKLCGEIRIFSLDNSARTWVKDHVEKCHADKDIEIDKVVGKKRIAGYMVHIANE